MVTEQTIEVSLPVGSRVTVFDDVDMDDGGFAGSVVFEGTVEQYSPDTRKLVFEDSTVGYSEFAELVDEYDSIQVING